VPIDMRDRHFTIPMMLDGHEIRAVIDTGADETILNASTAKRLFDIVPEDRGGANGKHDGRPIWRGKAVRNGCTRRRWAART
jgi:predicted aspartyl protease